MMTPTETEMPSGIYTHVLDGAPSVHIKANLKHSSHLTVTIFADSVKKMEISISLTGRSAYVESTGSVEKGKGWGTLGVNTAISFLKKNLKEESLVIGTLLDGSEGTSTLGMRKHFWNSFGFQFEVDCNNGGLKLTSSVGTLNLNTNRKRDEKSPCYFDISEMKYEGEALSG